MSRPKPRVIMAHTDPKTYKAEQVLDASAIYAVFFEEKPINLRSIHTIYNLGPKYKKVSFSNAGHAFNLAEKLNKLFKTDKFSVHKLVTGEKILEHIEEE